MNADLDDEITGLRSHVRQLRNVSCKNSQIYFFAICYTDYWHLIYMYVFELNFQLWLIIRVCGEVMHGNFNLCILILWGIYVLGFMVELFNLS